MPEDVRQLNVAVASLTEQMATLTKALNLHRQELERKLEWRSKLFVVGGVVVVVLIAVNTALLSTTWSAGRQSRGLSADAVVRACELSRADIEEVLVNFRDRLPTPTTPDMAEARERVYGNLIARLRQPPCEDVVSELRPGG